VRARLIQAGVKAEQIEFVESQTTLVRRASQEIAHESFVAAAQAAVADESTTVSGGVAPRPMVAPRGTVRLQTESVRRSGTQITVTIAAFVDEKRFNARTVTLRVTPKASLKVGQTVVVVVRSGGVAVQTKGTVRRVDGSTGQVTVQIETGRQLTGEVSAQGHVEVKA
jgi:ribosomal protein L35AE/L33A